MFLRKKLSLVVLTILLSACSHIQFANIPQIKPYYHYLSLNAGGESLNRALTDSLIAHNFKILSSASTKEELREALEAVQDNPNFGSHSNQKALSSCMQNLNYSCVRGYFPTLNMDSYSRYDKSLSLYVDGSVAQTLQTAEATANLHIPQVGDVRIADLVTNPSLTNSSTPLANIRIRESVDQIFYARIADKVAGKIVFVLEDQSQKDK